MNVKTSTLLPSSTSSPNLSSATPTPHPGHFSVWHFLGIWVLGFGISCASAQVPPGPATAVPYQAVPPIRTNPAVIAPAAAPAVTTGTATPVLPGATPAPADLTTRAEPRQLPPPRPGGLAASNRPKGPGSRSRRSGVEQLHRPPGVRPQSHPRHHRGLPHRGAARWHRHLVAGPAGLPRYWSGLLVRAPDHHDGGLRGRHTNGSGWPRSRRGDHARVHRHAEHPDGVHHVGLRRGAAGRTPGGIGRRRCHPTSPSRSHAQRHRGAARAPRTTGPEANVSLPRALAFPPRAVGEDPAT